MGGKKSKPVQQQRAVEYIPINIVLLGGAQSGKCPLMFALQQDKGVPPDDDQEVEFIQKVVTVAEEDEEPLHFKFKIQNPDIGEVKRLCAVASSYYEDTSGVVLVYNPSSQESFDAIENCFIDVAYFNPKKRNIPLLLVANQKDKGTPVVSDEQGKKLAEKLKIPFHHCNSTDFENVQSIVEYVARTAITNQVVSRPIPESSSFAIAPKNPSI